jgi:hypothetical protein
VKPARPTRRTVTAIALGLGLPMAALLVLPRPQEAARPAACVPLDPDCADIPTPRLTSTPIRTRTPAPTPPRTTPTGTAPP